MRALLFIALLPPVHGDVARPFSYAGDPFAAGHHRGVDLAARTGETVRAACRGRVLFAGRAGASGRAVTIRCGRFNVTHLPLAQLATEAGAIVRAGARIGTAGRARGHTGLHLGVRRASDPLGYVDPAPMLRTAAPRTAPPPAPRAPARRPAPPPPRPTPLPSSPAPRTAPVPSRPAPRTAPVPTTSTPAPSPGSSPPLAPWPAWAGLGLLLSGAAGAGTTRARRRRRAAHPPASAAAVR